MLKLAAIEAVPKASGDAYHDVKPPALKTIIIVYIYTVYIYNDYFLCVFSISSAEGSEGHLFAPRWDAD